MFDDLIGLPFVDGGRGPLEYDCWGLAKDVYNRYGINLPDYPISAMDAVKIGNQMTQDADGWQEVQKPLPVPCLVVMQLDCGSWANHVGVYIGDNQFIHACRATGVAIEPLKRRRSIIVGFYVPRG